MRRQKGEKIYKLINDNCKLIVNSFNQKDIDDYIKLMQLNNKIDISYEKLYKKFYALNVARLSESFCKEYFDILKHGKIKDKKIENVYEIVEYLSKIECNKQGVKKIHFSFSTKLLHTINPQYPIYDKRIAEFYFLPEIKSEWDKNKKISEYKKDYEFILEEYKKIIDNELFKIVINEFDNKIKNADQIGYVKKIDFIIWEFTSLLKEGAIRNKKIEYA